MHTHIHAHMHAHIHAHAHACTQAKSRRRAQRLADERRSRVELFEIELLALGLTVDEAADLSEAELRRIWRDRVRRLHPDVSSSVGADAMATDPPGQVDGQVDGQVEAEAAPTIYELNQAYETIKRVL